MSDGEDEDESYEAKSMCPICAMEYCTEHLVIVFADGHPHAGVLEHEWADIVRALKLRLVEAWLAGEKKIDGPRDLTKLLRWFTDIDRKKVIKEVTGEPDCNDPTFWSEEVHEKLGLDGNLDQEIEEIMVEALHNVDKTAEVSHSYEHGPCVFSGSEIYASNPQAVVRRFRMVFGLR